MWVLTALNTTEKYHMLTGRDYTVGRKDCDILVAYDQSISRRHASFHVSHPEANISHPHRPPTLTVTDTSKLGTLVGEAHIKGQQKQVKSGDILIFGTAGLSKYRAVYEPLICTTSCLDQASKRSTKQLMVRLGGHVVSDWRKECELLLMNSLSVTVKVICALVSLKPVVSIQYLEDLVRSYDNRTAEPKADTYVPILAESQLNPMEVSFKAEPLRKSLFQGKIFIFLSPKQAVEALVNQCPVVNMTTSVIGNKKTICPYCTLGAKSHSTLLETYQDINNLLCMLNMCPFKKLSLAVELAGGTPMLMEEGTDDNEDDILIGDDTCVMQCDADENTQTMSQNARDWLHYVRDLLKRNGKRMISDSELGYAVLYCSIERYCNPDKELGPVGSVTSQSQIVPQTVPDSVELGSVDPECTTSSMFDRLQHTSEPSVVPETESLPCPQQSQSGLGAPASHTATLPTVETSLAEDSCAVTSDSSRKRRLDEMATLPSQKQTKTEDEQSYISSVPGIKEEVETPKKVIIPPVNIPDREDREPHKAVMEKGLVKKTVTLQDSPSPGPAAIPESPVSSPGEQKCQNVVGSSPPTGVKVEQMDMLLTDKKTYKKCNVAFVASILSSRQPVFQPSGKANYKDVPPGFLSARVEEPLRASKYIKEDGVPCNLMVTIESSLVAKRTRPPRTKNRDTNMWNGKHVKNFKKFRKVRPAGASGLPRIIGRSDLEVHKNSNERDVDVVFMQEIQVESQQNVANKMAKELFEWQPLKKKGR